jgi:hypothetical protein
MDKSFRLYKVIETKDMSAEELQKILNEATDGFPEMQIDYVVGSKIILGYESLLNEKGRMESKLRTPISNSMKMGF